MPTLILSMVLKLRGVFGGIFRSNHRLIMRKKVPFMQAETATVPEVVMQTRTVKRKITTKRFFS